MNRLIKIIPLVALCLAGCSSSYDTEEPAPPSIGELQAQITANTNTIASQDQDLAQLRERLRHDSAAIDANSSQAQHLYIGPRLASPY